MLRALFLDVVRTPRGIEIDPDRHAATVDADRLRRVRRPGGSVAPVLRLAVLRRDDLNVARRRRRSCALKERIEEREAARICPKVGDRVAIDVRQRLVADRRGVGGVRHAEGLLLRRRHLLRPSASCATKPFIAPPLIDASKSTRALFKSPIWGATTRNALRYALGDRIVLRGTLSVLLRPVDAVRARKRAEVMVERPILLIDHEHVANTLANQILDRRAPARRRRRQRQHDRNQDGKAHDSPRCRRTGRVTLSLSRVPGSTGPKRGLISAAKGGVHAPIAFSFAPCFSLCRSPARTKPR